MFRPVGFLNRKGCADNVTLVVGIQINIEDEAFG